VSGTTPEVHSAVPTFLVRDVGAAAISLIGVISALVLALVLLKQPGRLRWVTLAVAAVCAIIYLAGYGLS
jgi:hypothetical protein